MEEGIKDLRLQLDLAQSVIDLQNQRIHALSQRIYNLTERLESCTIESTAMMYIKFKDVVEAAEGLILEVYGGSLGAYASAPKVTSLREALRSLSLKGTRV